MASRFSKLKNKVQNKKYCGKVTYKDLNEEIEFNVISPRGVKLFEFKNTVIEIVSTIQNEMGESQLSDLGETDILKLFKFILRNFREDEFYSEILGTLLELNDEEVSDFKEVAKDVAVFTLFMSAASMFISDTEAPKEVIDEAGNE